MCGYPTHDTLCLPIYLRYTNFALFLTRLSAGYGSLSKVQEPTDILTLFHLTVRIRFDVKVELITLESCRGVVLTYLKHDIMRHKLWGAECHHTRYWG